MNCEEARQEVARLLALQTEHKTALADLRSEARAVEAERGKLALAAVESSGKTTVVEAATSKLASLRVRCETTEALLAALDVKLSQAREVQRAAVVAELHKRADAAGAEAEKLGAKLRKLLAQVEEVNGAGTVLLRPDAGNVALLKRQAEQMHAAADSFVARGFPSPRDTTTGEPFDVGLW